MSAEVSGFIFANSRLSGLPDLSLSFVDADVIDDCAFHPCVRYNRYEKDRTVSFVPPDGQFEVGSEPVGQGCRLRHWWPWWLVLVRRLLLLLMLPLLLWVGACVLWSADAVPREPPRAHPASNLLRTTGNDKANTSSPAPPQA